MTTERKPAHSLRLGLLVAAAGLAPLLLVWARMGNLAACGMAVFDEAALALHALSRFEQWVVVLTAFGVKPTYMLLSLVLIVVLRKARGADLAALRWGLIAFLAGETACAVNYLFFGGRAEFVEYLHAYGMVVSFGFVTYAALEGIDQRLIHYSAPGTRCAALGLCHRCIKHDPAAPCGLMRLFKLMIPATMVLAFMPLTAALRPVSYRSEVLGSVVVYAHPLVEQWFELRYCPVLALGLLAVSWGVLLAGGAQAVARSKFWLAAGAGPLSFALVRFLLLAGWSERLLWKDAWEEITELLFVAGTAWVLWVFRAALLAAPRSAPDGPPRAVMAT